jgi:hypothetical protein
VPEAARQVAQQVARVQVLEQALAMAQVPLVMARAHLCQLQYRQARSQWAQHCLAR